MCATQRLNRSLATSSETLASAPCAALRNARTAGSDLDLGRRCPGAVGFLVGLVHHHALREHAGERFVETGMAGHFHRAGEEARIEQMQNRMLDAADVLVDGEEAVHDRTRGRRL